MEILKEFRNILLGYKIKVFTNHQNLVYKSEIKSSQQVMRWRLLQEEYDLEIEYIKPPRNVVADAFSRLPKQGDIVEDLLPFVPVDQDVALDWRKTCVLKHSSHVFLLFFEDTIYSRFMIQ